MYEQEKVGFYFRNRVDIEEWAALRTPAASALCEALAIARDRLVGDTEYLGLTDVNRSGDGAMLPIGGARGVVGVGLEWKVGNILAPGSLWPWLALITEGPTLVPTYDHLRRATRRIAAQHGLDIPGDQYMWKGRLSPESEPIDLEGYATFAMERMRAAWLDISQVIAEAAAPEDQSAL